MKRHADSAQILLPLPGTAALPPAETMQEKLAQLIYGSGKTKTIAIELYGAEHLNQSSSRLAKVLNPEGGTFLDPNKIVHVVRTLGDAARLDFAGWILKALEVVVDPSATKTGGLSLLPKGEPAARIEKLEAELLAQQKRTNELLEQVLEEKRNH